MGKFFWGIISKRAWLGRKEVGNVRLEKTIFNLEERSRVTNLVMNLLKSERPVNEEQEYKIRLVANELLVNIFQYSQPERVRMFVEYDDQELTLMFMNNGTGFEYNEVLKRDIRDQNWLMSEGGRGVMLVRGLSDNLEYSNHGKEVKVSLKLL
jgi:anti-sigma regulatory factor (Ser/Thr protein kinase)